MSGPDGTTTGRLIDSVAEDWRRVEKHPFLAAVAAGRLEPAVLERWVAADYAFNLEYLRFAGGLLAAAPDLPACRVLLDHLQFTRRTLDVLIETARGSAVDLDVEPGPFTIGFSSYLRALLSQGYERALVGLYCAKSVYVHGWSAVAPNADREAAFWPFLEHLSTEESGKDVEAIAMLVNEATPDGPTAEMTTTFGMVMQFELLFWSEVYVGVGDNW